MEKNSQYNVIEEDNPHKNVNWVVGCWSCSKRIESSENIYSFSYTSYCNGKVYCKDCYLKIKSWLEKKSKKNREEYQSLILNFVEPIIKNSIGGEDGGAKTISKQKS